MKPSGAILDAAFAREVEAWLPREASYLVAVSGGIDSMTLLHWLAASGYQDLVICHADHQLRGAESAKDAALVAATAARLGYECEQTCLEVAAVAAAERQSIETAARDLRYGWLASVAASREIPRVITGHHADDQVETVLMRLFRGAGNRGLSGMERCIAREIDGTEIEILRPLLPVFREEIERYAAEQEIDFREDESNHDDFSLRNRVRHRLLPMIDEVFERDVRGSVLRAAELSRRDEVFIEASLAESVHGELSVEHFRTLPAAQRDRLLLKWLAHEGVPDCGFVEVAKVVEVLRSTDKPAKANLPGGFFVRRRGGVLFIESPAASNGELG